MRKIAIGALLLLISAVLCIGCVRIVVAPPDGGEGNVEMISEQEALNVAEVTITNDFPDMVDAEKMNQSYAIKDREFYEFTYKKMVQVETDSGTLEIPRVVIVTVDKNTGDKSVAVSK